MIKPKILIADDHAMIRDGLVLLLLRSKEWEIAGEAVNGIEAVKKFQTLSPQLIILDISMPELSGMDAACQIMELSSSSKIIMLSMYEDEDYISRCIEIGVKGYVVKSETTYELEYAVRAVLRGQSYFSGRVQQCIFRDYSNSVVKKSKVSTVKLTRREVEIVRMIDQGFTSNQVADKLFISPRTVETHRSNLMKKVGAKNSIDLIRRVEKLGLTF